MSQRTRALIDDTTVAQARARVAGVTALAVRRMPGLLVECENLTEAESRWRFEQFLRDVIDAAAPSQAVVLAAEGE